MAAGYWYQKAESTLDALTLLGGASTWLATVKYVNAVRVSTGKSTVDVLKGLTPKERAQLTSELLTIRDPRLTPKLIQLGQAAGKLPKPYTTVQFRRATIVQIADAVGAGLAVASSTYSGNLKTIAIGFYQEG